MKTFDNFCLACGDDISDKRSDAKYCSDRCRMRYRREQQKEELITELSKLFEQMPNHSAQIDGDAVVLSSWDAISGKWQTWNSNDLENMSNQKIEALLAQKREELLTYGVTEGVKGLVNWVKKL